MVYLFWLFFKNCFPYQMAGLKGLWVLRNYSKHFYPDFPKNGFHVKLEYWAFNNFNKGIPIIYFTQFYTGYLTNVFYTEGLWVMRQKSFSYLTTKLKVEETPNLAWCSSDFVEKLVFSWWRHQSDCTTIFWKHDVIFFTEKIHNL